MHRSRRIQSIWCVHFSSTMLIGSLANVVALPITVICSCGCETKFFSLFLDKNIHFAKYVLLFYAIEASAKSSQFITFLNTQLFLTLVWHSKKSEQIISLSVCPAIASSLFIFLFNCTIKYTYYIVYIYVYIEAIL